MSEAIKKAQRAIVLANNSSCDQIEIAKVIAMAAQTIAIAELAEAVKSIDINMPFAPYAAPVQPVQYVPPSLGEPFPDQPGFPPYITCEANLDNHGNETPGFKMGEGLQPGEINVVSDRKVV